MRLDLNDLRWALQRLPKNLIEIMKEIEWHRNIFVGGGYLRAIVSGEQINDIDVFVKSEKDAELLAFKLSEKRYEMTKTENAYTVKSKIPIQIIHRWVFDNPEDVSNSFDFTICCAVIYYNGYSFDSFCDDRFYIDLASKRLIYRNPIRNEDAGGSMLRVLKYYQKGYKIPLDSLASVIARLVKDIDTNKVNIRNEFETSKILTGLLREVDPATFSDHLSHLTATDGLNIEEVTVTEKVNDQIINEKEFNDQIVDDFLELPF